MRALLLLVAGAWASDLAYPTPPNPFAAAPAQPPPPEDQPVIKGAERIRPRWRPSVKPLLCLGVLGLACVKEVPQETSLLAAFDAHFQRGRGLIPPQLRAEEYAFRHLGAVSAATHMDIFWLGIVGQWLPLVPLSVDALRHWLPALSTAHTILLLSALGYVLRRLLPRSVGDKSLGYSFRNLAHGRFWSFMSAAFCPTGLVHYLHISLLLLVAMPELEAILGFRKSLMLFAAAGTLAAVGGAIAQAPHRRHAAARSSASGAIAGVLALRAALLPHANVRFCGLELPPGRLLLLHLLLEQTSRRQVSHRKRTKTVLSTCLPHVIHTSSTCLLHVFHMSSPCLPHVSTRHTRIFPICIHTYILPIHTGALFDSAARRLPLWVLSGWCRWWRDVVSQQCYAHSSAPTPSASRGRAAGAKCSDM